MEKYGRVSEAKYENITWCMHFACWITTATNTHTSQLHHNNNGYTNAPQCYVLHTLPNLFTSPLFPTPSAPSLPHCLQWYICAFSGTYVPSVVYMCLQWYTCAFSGIYVPSVVYMCLQWYICAFSGIYVPSVVYMHTYKHS